MSNSDYYATEKLLGVLRQGDMVITISHPYGAESCANVLATHVV